MSVCSGGGGVLCGLQHVMPSSAFRTAVFPASCWKCQITVGQKKKKKRQNVFLEVVSCGLSWIAVVLHITGLLRTVQ